MSFDIFIQVWSILYPDLLLIIALQDGKVLMDESNIQMKNNSVIHEDTQNEERELVIIM